jgi:hypothetical protein
MSYHTWHTYGIGFCVYDIQTTPARLLELAALDSQTLLDVENYLTERFDGGYLIGELTMEDFCDLEGDFCERDISYVLRRVIKEIPVVYVDDYEGTPYILYCPTYPWNLTENEIGLTREKVEGIFEKYIEILTDDVIDIDWQEVENGG